MYSKVDPVAAQSWLGDSAPPYCVVNRSPEAALIRRRIAWLRAELEEAEKMRRRLDGWLEDIAPGPTAEETPVESLNISQRSVMVLRSLGCQTLSDVGRLKKSALMRTPNCGRKSIEEIERVVKCGGMRLAA